MFKRLFGRRPQLTLPELDTDIAMDDLELRAARAKALAGDWTAARDIVAATGRDWELRGRRIMALAAVAERGDWFGDWVRVAPDDPTAAVITSSLLMDRASRARGASSAKNTTDEQFEGFARFAAQAEEAGRRAVTLAPDDPTPWGIMLTSYLAGGRRHRDAFDRAFDEGARRDPYNFDVHLMAVTYHCAKWYGSHERMFEAARSVAADAPVGSTAAMLPFLAHFEYAMREYSWDVRSPEARAKCSEYFLRADVRQELDFAVAKWRAGGPRPLGRSMTCRHWEVLGYVLAGRRAEARAVFDEIGPYFGGTAAWGYFWMKKADGFHVAWQWAHE